VHLRAHRRRIRYSAGIKQPAGQTHQRRQGRPIELAELLLLGEQQHRIDNFGCCRGIQNRLPHPFTLGPSPYEPAWVPGVN
jgi:hypothetical protein